MMRQRPKGMGVATPGSGKEFIEARIRGPFSISGSGQNPLYALLLTQPESLNPITHSTPKPSEVRDMSHMSKLVTGVALGTSGGTILNGVLTKLSPDEWSAVGVLAGIVGIIITGLINWYFKRKVANAQVKALEKYGPAVKVGDE